MMALSPFEETLFLDADTVVLDTLDFGFLAAERTGLACCINENPWARRYRGLPNDDAIEYNTGVLFFNRTSTSLFRRWEELAKEVDSAIPFIRDNEVLIMPFADQGSFAKAVSEWDRLPFVLPINWNFRPEWHGGWFGPLKIWHAYASPPPQLTELLAYYKSKDAVIQFHELKRA